MEYPFYIVNLFILAHLKAVLKAGINHPIKALMTFKYKAKIQKTNIIVNKFNWGVSIYA